MWGHLFALLVGAAVAWWLARRTGAQITPEQWLAVQQQLATQTAPLQARDEQAQELRQQREQAQRELDAQRLRVESLTRDLATLGAELEGERRHAQEKIELLTQARETYENTDLRQRLSRYHADVDSAFWGWNRIWLDPRFRSWSIEEDIRAITCPVLAIQGIDDEYGTLAQIRGIAARVPHTQLLELPHCGHSPHRDQPEILIQGCVTFFNAQPHVPLSQPRQP